MNAAATEVSPLEFVDVTPLTIPLLEALGFPVAQKPCSIDLPNGKLFLTYFNSMTGVWCHFENEDGKRTDLAPHAQTVGDMKYLIWRLSRSLALQSNIQSF